MVTNQEWLSRREKALPKGIASACPVFIERAENSELWDVEGNRYIDFAGGIAVMNTGHVHPKITAAVEEQVRKFSHTAYQVLQYGPYVELCERLNALAPGETPKKSVLFSTGAEAVENAVKIAKYYTQRSAVISFVGGFHGRTMYTLGLTGKVDPYKKGLGPLPQGIHHLPFPMEPHGVTEEDSLKALMQLFKADVDPQNVAAIILEPVQGEGGFYAASPSFFESLRTLCDANGILLIADEVQSGIGRTGTLFAVEQSGVEPDLMTTAKSLASGYPLSAVVGKSEIMDAPHPGFLGGTYGGNPVACVAALAVLDVIEEENLLKKSTDLGRYLVERVTAFKNTGHQDKIGDIRTMGAMMAFELIDADGNPSPERAKALTSKSLEHNLVLLSCGVFGNTIRVLVPLTVSRDVLDEGLDIIEQCLNEI